MSRIYGDEAFPAIVMPSFGVRMVGTDNVARVTDRQIQVIDANGTSHSVAPETLLAPMPVASAISTLDRIFEPSAKAGPELPPDTVDYLRRQAEQLHLDSAPVRLRLVWQPENFDVRSMQRTPAGEAKVREVKW